MQNKHTVVFVPRKNPVAAKLISKEINDDKDFTSLSIPFDQLVTKTKIAYAKSIRFLNNQIWKPISFVMHKVIKSVKVAETMRSYDGAKRQRVHNMFYRYAPSVVVVSEPYALFTMVKTGKKMGKMPNIFILSNDIGFNVELIDKNVKHYFVDNVAVREQLLQKGVFADKIDVCPLPIESKFFAEVDQEKIRHKMGVRKDAKVVVMYPDEKNKKELVDFAAENADKAVFAVLPGDSIVVREYAEEKGVLCLENEKEADAIAASNVVVSPYHASRIKKAAAMKKYFVCYGEGNETVSRLVAEGKVFSCADIPTLESTLKNVLAEDEDEESEPIFDETNEKSAKIIADRIKELVLDMSKEEEQV